MQTSSFLTSLGQRRAVFGFAHMIQDDTITESLRHADLDFVLLDMQHVAITIETLQRTLIALQPSALTVLVRPPGNDPIQIGQILDAGAHGVVVPMVNNGQEARQAVAAAKYPPDGLRSWGSRRAALGYESREAYARDANDNAIVIVQVETVEAIENLDQILNTPGLAGVMIGPADLAISMGYIDDRANPAIARAIEGVLRRCLERDVPFGYFGASLDIVLPWVAKGGLIFNCAVDTMFVAAGLQSLTAGIASVRTDEIAD